jgi:hypothetical protein
VQKIGGHVALIVDNTIENSSKFLMLDDGSGKDLSIPAVLISKSDREIIKNFWLDKKKRNENIDIYSKYYI